MEAPRFADMSDHEVLVLMAQDIHDIKGALHDNGQPGLLTRVARLEGAGNKQAAKSGGLSAVVAVAVAVVMHRLGIGS